MKEGSGTPSASGSPGERCPLASDLSGSVVRSILEFGSLIWDVKCLDFMASAVCAVASIASLPLRSEQAVASQ